MNNYIKKDNETYILRITNRKGRVHVVLLDAEDLPKVKPYKWRLEGKGYASTTIEGERWTMPQLLFNQKTDRKHVFDHLNGNPLDNRKSNLRLTTASANCTNRKAKCKSNTGIRTVHQIQNGTYRIRDTYKGTAPVFKTVPDAMTAKALSLAKLGIPIERYPEIFDNSLSMFRGYLADIIFLKFLEESRECA